MPLRGISLRGLASRWFTLMNRTTPTARPPFRAQTRPGSHRARAMGARRRSRENVALHPQLLVLAPEACQLLALGRSQGRVGRRRLHLPPALLPISLKDPVADRLGGRFERAGKIGRIAAGTHQIDDRATQLRGIRGTGRRHGNTFRESGRGVHQTGAISPDRCRGTGPIPCGTPALRPSGAGHALVRVAIGARPDQADRAGRFRTVARRAWLGCPRDLAGAADP